MRGCMLRSYVSVMRIVCVHCSCMVVDVDCVCCACW